MTGEEKNKNSKNFEKILYKNNICRPSEIQKYKYAKKKVFL